MQQFWFYIQLGFDHVMDPSAYDHVLFLAALVLPFSFSQWKKVVVLATVFTIAHCLSLALSAYGILAVDSQWIEFLIPVTILFTALFDLLYVRREIAPARAYLHLPATAFFGAIHGFGFSSYFKMMMAETSEKAIPLLGFACGIEISQLLVIFAMLLLAWLLQVVFRLKRSWFIAIGAIIVVLITIPLLVATFPN
jgi:hypothetical protein